jgi:hypothetical protein
VLEYEGVADRMLADLAVSAGDLSDILDYLCSVAIPDDLRDQTVEDPAHFGAQTSATAPPSYSTCRTTWGVGTGAGALRSNAS